MTIALQIRFFTASTRDCSTIENRFAAEDREFNLGRVFSYQKPGQLLACAVAMAMWNFRIVADLASVSENTPSCLKRPRPSTGTESADALHETVATQHPSGTEDRNGNPPDADQTDSVEADAVPRTNGDQPDADQTDSGPQDHDHMASDDSVLDWCQRNPGWQALDDSIQYPAGQQLHPTFRTTTTSAVYRFHALNDIC